MTAGQGEAVVEVRVWKGSSARFGGVTLGVGSGGSQTALLAPIISSAQWETAVFSNEEEQQLSLLTTLVRLPAASVSWLGGDPSSHQWEQLFPRKTKQRGASQHQRVKSSPLLWLVVYIAPVYSQLLP